MGFIANEDNPRYMLFLSINSNPKNWEYTHFIMNMKKEYSKSLGFTGSWLEFRINNQDDFTEFIKGRVDGIYDTGFKEEMELI